MALHHAANNLATGKVTEVAHVVVGNQTGGVFTFADFLKASHIGLGSRQHGDVVAPLGRAVQGVEVGFQGGNAFEGRVDDVGGDGVFCNCAGGFFQRAVEQPALLLKDDEFFYSEVALEEFVHESGVLSFFVGGCS